MLRRTLALTLGLAGLAALPTTAALAGGNLGDGGHAVRHVLLISVDGMHALDLSNYVKSHPNSTLAALSSHGIPALRRS